MLEMLEDDAELEVVGPSDVGDDLALVGVQKGEAEPAASDLELVVPEDVELVLCDAEGSGLGGHVFVVVRVQVLHYELSRRSPTQIGYQVSHVP